MNKSGSRFYSVLCPTATIKHAEELFSQEQNSIAEALMGDPSSLSLVDTTVVPALPSWTPWCQGSPLPDVL